MKIKEICEKSGLSERTVRYYCEQRLVDVETYTQNGRDYLNFSEQDLEDLKNIAVLRRADFSIDEIRQMICESYRIRPIVEARMAALAAQSRESDRVRDALADISTVRLSTMEDVVHLLENRPTHSTVAPLKAGEMTFSDFCEREGYCKDNDLFVEIDRQTARGRVIFTVYLVFAIITMALNLVIGLGNGSMFFSNLLSIGVTATILYFLYRGYGWARFVVTAIHGLNAVFMLFLTFFDAVPQARVIHQGSMTEVGDHVMNTITVYPTASDWIVFALAVLCLLLEIACFYFLGFNKSLQAYLYDNCTGY